MVTKQKSYNVKKNTINPTSEKNYNPFKAFLEFYQDMSSGDSVISNFKALYQKSLDQKKSKYVSGAVNRKASEIGYSDEVLQENYDKIYEEIKSQYPNIWMKKATFMEQALSGVKAFGETGLKTGSKLMKIGSQAIGEKVYSMADSIPGFGDKVSGLLKNIGFDKEKIKPKPIALFSVTGEINNEAFYDENREGFIDFAKDVFVSKPIGILFKTFGSGAVGGIFIIILGPIGLIPAIGIQAMGFKSTFESIAIEIPEKLFMLISTTALNGFKNSDKIPESIQIELKDEEIFIKDQDGIIIGNSRMTPEEKDFADQFVQDLGRVNDKVNEINKEIIKDQGKQPNDKQFESILNKFVDAYKKIPEDNKNQEVLGQEPDLSAILKELSKNSNFSSQSFTDRVTKGSESKTAGPSRK